MLWCSITGWREYHCGWQKSCSRNPIISHMKDPISLASICQTIMISSSTRRWRQTETLRWHTLLSGDERPDRELALFMLPQQTTAGQLFMYLSIFNVHLFSAAIHSFNQFNYHSLSVLTKQLLNRFYLRVSLLNALHSRDLNNIKFLSFWSSTNFTKKHDIFRGK